MIFLDGWIKFFNDTYLFLAVCILLNCYFFRWGTSGDVFNSLVTISFGAIVILFPIFLAIFYNLNKNYKLILQNDASFLGKFGSAIKDLNFKKNGRKVLVHAPAVALRKLWLAVILVLN